MEAEMSLRHSQSMEHKDPFLRGFSVLLDMRPDLKPSRISTDAGLDNSTLRKLLRNPKASPRIDTAEALAAAAGYSMSAIVALGQHPDARGALAILEAYEKLDPNAQQELSTFLDFLVARSGAPQS